MSPRRATLSLSDPVEGPPVERHIALDMVRRGVPVAPVLVLLGGLGWGAPGAWSAAYAVGLVLANFVLAAALMGWSARISLAALMGAALGGYLLRLMLVTVAVLAVKDQSWVELVPLGLTLMVTHLGLLVWEARHVSASLAYPGLKPRGGPLA